MSRQTIPSLCRKVLGRFERHGFCSRWAVAIRGRHALRRWGIVECEIVLDTWYQSQAWRSCIKGNSPQIILPRVHSAPASKEMFGLPFLTLLDLVMLA